jgi:hypothetical protein
LVPEVRASTAGSDMKLLRPGKCDGRTSTQGREGLSLGLALGGQAGSGPGGHLSGEVEDLGEAASRSTPVARLDRMPLRHMATISRSLGSSAKRAGSCPSGTCLAPGAWALRHSSASRTSRISAPPF